MNYRLVILLLLVVCSSTLFSACTNVESKTQEEVVINGDGRTPRNEVVITDADLKDENEQISNLQETSKLPKRLLSDRSVIETLIDGYGNKTETRYFPGHPRVKLVILRTSADGQQEVSVYGYGETKTVAGLGEKALTASGDEIAGIAELPAMPKSSATRNYLKGRKPEPTLQPLPSSAFQKPVIQYNQPVESIQSETNVSGETSTVQQNQANED